MTDNVDESKVTAFKNAVVSKINALISSHNTSNSAHSDIRTTLDTSIGELKSYDAIIRLSKYQDNGKGVVILGYVYLDSLSTSTITNKDLYVQLPHNLTQSGSSHFLIDLISSKDNSYTGRLALKDSGGNNVSPNTYPSNTILHIKLESGNNYFTLISVLDGNYNSLINKPTIPSKVSDLTNDTGFITSSSLPTKTSDLTNDGDGTNAFLTAHQSLTNYVQKSNTTGLLKNDGTVDANTYLTSHQDITGKENVSNKETSWSSDYTGDTDSYPTSQLVKSTFDQYKFEHRDKSKDLVFTTAPNTTYFYWNEPNHDNNRSFGGGNYDYYIDWGDGNAYVCDMSQESEHEYSVSGQYTITVSPINSPITKLGYNLFFNLYHDSERTITSIQLPSTLINIEDECFRGQDGLDDVDIIFPESLAYIGYDAFSGVEVRNVIFKGSVPPTIENDGLNFDNGFDYQDFYVPNSSWSQYSSALAYYSPSGLIYGYVVIDDRMVVLSPHATGDYPLSNNVLKQNYVQKSSTTGLLKNDGSVMSSGTGASNWAVGNHTHTSIAKTTVITTGSLDTVTDTGWYSYSSSNASSITNVPVTVGSMMQVLDDYGDGSYVMQIVHTLPSSRDSEVYYRQKYSSRGWGSWKKVMFDSDVNALIGSAITYINQ